MSDSDEDVQTSAKVPSQEETLPALFWDRLPDNAEENPDFAALKALAEEDPPEVRAENFKTQGNKKLQVGLQCGNKVLFREAIHFYQQGLELKCGDDKINAALHNNKAHVESLLGNWRKALDSSLEAIRLDPSNVKAHFRGARAALKLSQHAQCKALCQAGMAVDPVTKEFAPLIKECEAHEAEQRRTAERLAAEKEAREAPARQLAKAVISRGLKVTRPQVRSNAQQRPYLDEQGLLHWPLLLLYPQAGSQDCIQDVCETDVIGDHLDEMFGPEAPPLEWDEAQEYTRERVELYYLSHGGQPLGEQQLLLAYQGQWPGGPQGQEDGGDDGPTRYGDKAARWRLVSEHWKLAELLTQPDHVIPGVPLLFVVAKGTTYREQFLAEKLKR